MDYTALRNFVFDDRVHSYGPRDTILYALGIGLGADPLDAHQLRFVYERGLEALPTLGVVLANASPWLARPELCIDWRRVVHGEHCLELHRPVPPEGRLRGVTRIDAVIDKGPGKGALVYLSRDVYEEGVEAPLLRVGQTLICRGDGGCGAPAGPVHPPFPLPSRPPDLAVDLAILPQAALLYRLSGDMNPLHADPHAAARAGFTRPILHGLCTFGVAGHALLKGVLDYMPERMRGMRARFSAPVYPGDTLCTEIWRLERGAYGFRCKARERDLVVLDNGHATAWP